MYLVMHVNGEEVERRQLLNTSKISQEMDELRKKYNEEIKQANAEPEFYLSEVPSSINRFKSLLSKNNNQIGLPGI